jgi:hypothetical protein
MIGKRIICQKVIRLGVISMVLHFILGSASLFAYGPEVHKEITSKAIDKSFLDVRLKQLGFEDGVQYKFETWKENSIRQWIQYGSEWEDLILFWCIDPISKKGIKNSHFYNPVEDVGLWDYDENEEIGQSLIDRANDNEIGDYGMPNNEWSNQMAKDLYYAALTGDSTKYPNWVMRDKIRYDWFFGKNSMTQDEREQFFAWTFQALGHTLHLIQDASVPAHTRNDSHMHMPNTRGILQDTEPFEDWIDENVNDLKYTNPGSASWPHWKDHIDIPVPNVFIDTHPLPDPTHEPGEDLNQGLAEYSHANFLSKDSMFDFDFPEKPSGPAGVPSYDNDVVEFETDVVNDKQRFFLYLKSKSFDGYLALCGILYHINIIGPLEKYVYATKYTVDDQRVHSDYAAKLIPLAVGYSAGLLDYFFRGEMDMVRDGFDGYVIENKTEEPMNGTFELYYDNTNDERVRLWQMYFELGPFDPEHPDSDDNKSTNFSFDEPDDAEEPGKYILVFRGTLGNETDAVVGKVGMIEPATFYLCISIDGNDLYWGGQRLSVYYTDKSGQWQNAAKDAVYFNAPTDKGRETYGYTMGLVGPFQFANRDKTKPVYVELKDQRDIAPYNSYLFDEFDAFHVDEYRGLGYWGRKYLPGGQEIYYVSNMLGYLTEDNDGTIYYKKEEAVDTSDLSCSPCDGGPAIHPVRTSHSLKHGLYKKDPGEAMKCSRPSELYTEINFDALSFSKQWHFTESSYPEEEEISVAFVDVLFNLQMCQRGRIAEDSVSACGDDYSGTWVVFTPFSPPNPFPIINFVPQLYWGLAENTHAYESMYAVFCNNDEVDWCWEDPSTCCWYTTRCGPGTYEKIGLDPAPVITNEKTPIGGVEDLGINIEITMTHSWLAVFCPEDCDWGNCRYGGHRDRTYVYKSVPAPDYWF